MKIYKIIQQELFNETDIFLEEFLEKLKEQCKYDFQYTDRCQKYPEANGDGTRLICTSGHALPK